MKEKGKNGLLKKLGQLSILLKPLSGWIILSCFTAFLNAIFMMFLAFISGRLADMAKNQQVKEFKSLVFYTLIAVGVNVVVSYIKKYSTARYKAHFNYDIRNHFVSHVIDLSPKDKEKYHSGDIVSRSNNDISIITELIGTIPEFISNPTMFIAAFIGMYLISWKLLLASIVLIPLSGYLFDMASKPVEANSKKIMEDTAKVNALAKDTINGVYVLKSFNLEETLLNKYKANIQEIVKRGVKIERINASLGRLFLTLRYIPQLIIPLLGGYLAIKGQITVGQLLASMQLIWYVFIPVEALLGLKKQMRESVPAVDRIFEVINESIESQTGDKFEIMEGCPAIKVSRVSFGYNEENQILNNLSFELSKGTVTAIVGPSGCGKSTILKLLCGFYNIENGNVEVFGNNLKNCRPSDVRKNISIVSQSTYLFPATIEENIAYGRDGAAKEDIIKAAKMANAHDFIMSLPDGYKTIIGDGSTKLSGGQQQRISLARAILKDAPILFLDEATSALDLESENLVQKSLQEFMKNRTVLVVAHRMSTIKNADVIMVIKDGEVLEKGKHDEFIERDSFYKKLYQKQFDINESGEAILNA